MCCTAETNRPGSVVEVSGRHGGARPEEACRYHDPAYRHRRIKYLRKVEATNSVDDVESKQCQVRMCNGGERGGSFLLPFFLEIGTS